MAKNMFRIVRRHPGRAPSPPPDPLPSIAAMNLTVQVTAGITGAAITQLESGLQRAITDLARSLGVVRGVSIEVTRPGVGENTVAVWVEGRPLAVGLAAGSGLPAGDWARNLVSSVAHALLRRPSMLLDAPLAEQHAARLQASMSDDRRDSYRGVPAYLLDSGISLPGNGQLNAPPGLRQCDSGAEIGELLIDGLAPPEIVVEIAEATLRNTPADAAAALVGAREGLYAQTGVQFPDVQIVPADQPSSVVAVRLNQVRLPEFRVAEESGWQGVVPALSGILRAFAPWFLRVSDVRATRTQLGDVLPDLISLSRSLYPDPLLSACLRSLMVHGDSIRNLPRILWLLLEAGAIGPADDRVRLAESPHLPSAGTAPVVQRDPELLASALRKVVAEEAWRVGAPGPADPCVCLPPEVERSLIEPADADALAHTELRAVAMLSSLDRPFQVAAHSALALRPLRYALLALPEPPRVVASQELPPDTEIQPVPAS
jgi:hypothetical protein